MRKGKEKEGSLVSLGLNDISTPQCFVCFVCIPVRCRGDMFGVQIRPWSINHSNSRKCLHLPSIPMLPAHPHPEEGHLPACFCLSHCFTLCPLFFLECSPKSIFGWALEAHFPFSVHRFYFVLCKRSGEGAAKKEEKTGWRRGVKQDDGCCGSARGILPAQRDGMVP